MRSSLFNVFTGIVTLSFTAYSILGCGPSSATKHLEKYEEYQYTEMMIIRGQPDDVYRASVKALQEREFVVTLSDPQTGLINGEKQSASMIPEDQKALDEATESPSVGSIIVGVLAIIFIVGLIAILAGSCNDKEEDSSAKRPEKERGIHEHHYHYEPTPKTSYRYVVSLTLSSHHGDSTAVDIKATKIILENGAVMHSVNMKNKYLNYEILDAIAEQMYLRD